MTNVSKCSAGTCIWNIRGSNKCGETDTEIDATGKCKYYQEDE